jgi:hypothetical protein
VTHVISIICILGKVGNRNDKISRARENKTIFSSINTKVSKIFILQQSQSNAINDLQERQENITFLDHTNKEIEARETK